MAPKARLGVATVTTRSPLPLSPHRAAPTSCCTAAAPPPLPRHALSRTATPCHAEAGAGPQEAKGGDGGRQHPAIFRQAARGGDVGGAGRAGTTTLQPPACDTGMRLHVRLAHHPSLCVAPHRRALIGMRRAQRGASLRRWAPQPMAPAHPLPVAAAQRQRLARLLQGAGPPC